MPIFKSYDKILWKRRIDVYWDIARQNVLYGFKDFVFLVHHLSEMQQVGMLQFMLNLIITPLFTHGLTFLEGGGGHVMFRPIRIVVCYQLTPVLLFCLPPLYRLPLSRRRLRSCSSVSTGRRLVTYFHFFFFFLFFFFFNKTHVGIIMCISGRAILMQITRTRMWGKGIQTRSWKRYLLISNVCMFSALEQKKRMNQMCSQKYTTKAVKRV